MINLILFLFGCEVREQQVVASGCVVTVDALDAETTEVNGVSFDAAREILGAEMVRDVVWEDGAFALPEGVGADTMTIEWSLIEGSLAQFTELTAAESGVGASCRGEALYFEADVSVQTESDLVSGEGQLAFAFTEASETGWFVPPDGDRSRVLAASISTELAELWLADSDCDGADSIHSEPTLVFSRTSTGEPQGMGVEGGCTSDYAVSMTVLARTVLATGGT